MGASEVTGKSRPAGSTRLSIAVAALGGFLLFALEPAAARAVLPRFGGSAFVWTTCLAVFQALLVGGYAYAQFTARLGNRGQVAVHLGVVVCALWVLPLDFGSGQSAPIGTEPVLGLAAALIAAVGLPALTLCASSSLIQQWLARSRGHGSVVASRAYSASNAGSLVGLLAYPLLIEPVLGLSAQATLWTYGYLLFVLMLAAVALGQFRSAPSEVPVGQPSREPVSRWRDRAMWWALSFVPCSLLLGLTAHMTHELPSNPIIWVIPLALYLLTLIVAFAQTPPGLAKACATAEPVLLAILAVMMIVPIHSSGYVVHLCALSATCLVLHTSLVARAPGAHERGLFVLIIAIGGASAGLFNAVLAPRIFPILAELPLAMVAACLLRVALNRKHTNFVRADVWVPLVLAVLTLFVLAVLPHVGDARDLFSRVTVVFVAAAAAVTMRHRPLRFAAAMAVVLFSGIWTFQIDSTETVRRSPYGVSRVVRDLAHERNLLFHGSTIHGAQAWPESDLSSGPQFYFHPDGPLGEIMTSKAARDPGRRFAVIGLGAGSIAWYLTATQSMRFFEIDPVVVELAQSPQWFRFLAESRGSVDIVLGDGRLSLASEPAHGYDLIVVDVFSSAAVPIHMLTREAMQVYFDKLAPGGLIAFNLSNRHVDVGAVMVSVANSLGWESRLARGPDPSNREMASWGVVARVSDFVRWGVAEQGWRTPAPSTMRPWTDDHASLVSAIRW